MSQITGFLPQLQQLRAIYADFIQLDEMDFDAYRKVVDFYYAHRDVGQFEKMILDILFEKDKQTTAIVLASLKSELSKILEIYYENDGTFNEVPPLNTNGHPCAINASKRENARITFSTIILSGILF